MGMSREEFYLIASGLRAAYGADKCIPNKTAFDVWYELLKDLDYETASKAAQMYMMQEHFPPVPADIRKKVSEMQSLVSDMTEGEAWSLVRNALSNGIYGYEAEYARLPGEIQKAIGDSKQLHIWAIDENFNESVVQSQFLRSYRQVRERKKSMSMLPTKMQNLIVETANKMISG